MEHLPNGFTLKLPSGTFPLSTDSMVLSHFVKLPKNARVLDLGSGCGTLGMMLCAIDPRCTVTGLEIDPEAHTAAVENIARNSLQTRLNSICSDLRSFPGEIVPGSFDVCVSNPPYFSGGPASTRTPIARRDDCCRPEELMHAAGKALKYGGDFFIVQKPEKLAQLITCAAAEKLEAKRLCLVRHKEGGPVTTILIQFRMGGKPGLILEEFCLFHSDGTPTEAYRKIYHI